MVDPLILLAKWLRTSTGLQALLPNRGGTWSIYAPDLPESFDIDTGPAIVLASRGGTPQTEIHAIIKPRIQITVWAGVLKYLLARQVYNVLYDFIDGKGAVVIAGTGTILSCYEVVPPQDITDPDTDWAMVVSFYEMFARS